jgi:uncharacterized membrane protein YgcG
MMRLTDVTNGTSNPEPPRAAVRDSGRVVAGIGGLLALAIAARFTFGAALLAPIGMAVASAIVRKRHHVLTRRTTWAGAVIAVGVVLICATAIPLAFVPAGTFAQIQRTADSVSAAPQPPPPAWLERIAPGASASSAAQRRPSGALGSAFNVWAMVVGSVFVTAILSAFIGTIGWAVSLPLVYAFTGRWLPSSRAPTAAP